MKRELMTLYRVRWAHTANTYVVANTCCNLETIKNMVSHAEDRCDSIVDIERIVLPAFDDDKLRKTDYVSIFYDLKFA